MSKIKLILSFLAILSAVGGQAQNQLKVFPVSHGFTTAYGVESTVKVKVTCEGNQPNTPLSLNLSTCQSDATLLSITYSNGTSLTPGNSTIITFKFKKSSSDGADTTVINYKYALGYGCGSSESVMIDIRGAYIHRYGKYCTSGFLDQPTDFFASGISPYCVTYNWSPVSNAEFYKVDCKSSTTDQLLQTSANSIVLCGLTPGETYKVSLKAYYNDEGCDSGNGEIIQTIKVPCNDVPPTGITATPYSYGYTISYSPQGSCLMEYVDLVSGTSGTTTIATSTSQGGMNFFYYVTQGHSFKFRLKSFNSSCALFSDWIVVDPSLCSPANYPTDLMVYSQCGSSNLPSVCGGIVHWTRPANTSNYQIEYLIFNQTGQTYIGTFSSSSNSQTLSQYTSSGTGPWLIKVRAKAQCTTGAWTDFSPWSANFAW